MEGVATMSKHSHTAKDSAAAGSRQPPRGKQRKQTVAPHVKASRRLFDMAAKDYKSAHWHYTRHAQGLLSSLENMRHAAGTMLRAALSIADMVYTAEVSDAA